MINLPELFHVQRIVLTVRLKVAVHVKGPGPSETLKVQLSGTRHASPMAMSRVAWSPLRRSSWVDPEKSRSHLEEKFEESIFPRIADVDASAGSAHDASNQKHSL